MFCSHERSQRTFYRFEVPKAKAVQSILLAVLLLAHGPIASAQSTGGNLVSYPSPEMEFIIGPHVRALTDPLASYYDDAAVRRGKYWANQFLANPVFVSSNHYDLPLCLYILYYRTGDAEFLTLARQVAEKWFNSPYINQGNPVAGQNQPGALYSSLSGLMLYALDTKRADVWGYLDAQTRALHQAKVVSRIGNIDPNTNKPGLVFDLRESGYAQLWAVELARVLPDSFTQVKVNEFTSTVIGVEQVTDGATRRAKYLADAERAAVEYFGKTQAADGGWRWNLWIEPYTKDVEQPFMLGIYLESAVRLHQFTQNGVVKDSLASQITRACEHLYRDTYRKVIEPGYTSIPRATLYWWPLELNSQDYQASDRHLTTSQLHAFGYAYKITGDPKYITWGDDMWDSCYHVPGDGYSALIDAPNYLKLFTMEARSAGNYLAWRQGAPSQPQQSPTPTPTPTSTPIPTPTPSNLTVKFTSPSTNTTYSFGSSPSLAATASSKDSTVAGVAFKANTQVLGTLTTAPYSIVWNSPAAGTYTLTATATDAKGLVVASSPLTVKISKALKAVRNGKTSAANLESSLANSSPTSFTAQSAKANEVDSLVAVLDDAYLDFSNERTMFDRASDIDRYLFAAIFLAKASSGLAKQQTSTSGIIDRLNKIDAYLTFCEDLMVDGVISNQSISSGNKAGARTDISFSRADVLPLGNNSIHLLQNGTAAITSPMSNPLTSVTEVAPSSGAYELAGVSVTVGGNAVSLLSVSPTAITFFVPGDLPGGLADVIVTCRDGYITHSTASVTGLNPMIFVQQGTTNPPGAIFESVQLRQGAYSPFSSQWYALDSSTRLTLLATGISSGLVNTNSGNDIWLANGKMLENYAESVVVEARRADGKVVQLPVEYAGSQGTLRGLDQVTIRLTPELAGAGTVQITVVAGGRRSNTSGILVN